MKKLVLFFSTFAFLLSTLTAADLTVTAANVVASSGAKFGQGTAGATITAGQTIYRKASDNKIYLADANVTTNGEYKVAGIAVNAATAGQPIKYVISDPAFTPGGTTAAGTVYVMSATAGGIAPSADAATGHYVSVLGVGISATQMKLQIIRSDVAKP